MVVELGGSNLAVGALGVIFWSGLFLPQVFAARYFESNPWKKPWTIRLGFVQRILLGLIALFLFLYGETEPSIALTLFVVLFALIHILLGVITPGWFDLIAKIIPRLLKYRR